MGRAPRRAHRIGRAGNDCIFVGMSVALEHDPEKWIPVFPRDKREAFARRSCSNKKIEWDDDSKKSHPALAPRMLHYARSVAQKGLLNAGNPAAIQSFCL